MIVEESRSFHRSILLMSACRVISVSSTAISLLVLDSVAVIAFSTASLTFAVAPTSSSRNESLTSHVAHKEISPYPVHQEPEALTFLRFRPTNFGIDFVMNQLVIDPNLEKHRGTIYIFFLRHSKIAPFTKNDFLVMSITIVRTNFWNGRVRCEEYLKFNKIIRRSDW